MRLVADLGDRGHVQRMVELAIPPRVEPVADMGPAGGFDGGGAVVAGVMATGCEPPHIAGMAIQQGRHDRAHAVNVDDAGPRRGHRDVDARLERDQLVVDAAHIGQQITGHALAFHLHELEEAHGPQCPPGAIGGR